MGSDGLAWLYDRASVLPATPVELAVIASVLERVIYVAALGF